MLLDQAIQPNYETKIMFDDYDSIEHDENKMYEMLQYCIFRFGIDNSSWGGCENILGCMKNGQLGYIGMIFHFYTEEDLTEFKLRFL